MSKKVQLTRGMEGVTFGGKPCFIDSINRGWATITTHAGFTRKVRVTELTVAGAAPVAQDPPATVAAPAQSKQETDDMAKKGKTKKPRAARVTNGTGRHVATKDGDAYFARFGSYKRSKTAEGNVTFDNDDEVAAKLRGKTLAEVYEIVAKKLDVSERSLRDKYGKLNDGLARMSLGNKLRGALRAEGKL